MTLVSWSGVTGAKQGENLFSINSKKLDKQDAIVTSSRATNEWVVLFDVSMVSADSRHFTLTLPGVQDDLLVSRTGFKNYISGDIQWSGDIRSHSKTYDEKPLGSIIVNVVNGMPFAVIELGEKVYEVHSSYASSIRLVEMINSGHSHDTEHFHGTEEYLSAVADRDVILANLQGNQVNKKLEQRAAISTVDVLVVVDDDLNFPGSAIFNKINTEFDTANRILTNTKINAANDTDVLLRLNHIGTQYIDIPNELEEIIQPFNGYKHLKNDTSALSVELKTMLKNSGADYLAVYIPFDPEGSSAQEPLEACGIATSPTPATDLSLDSSIVLLADTCNEDQFVLLHELIHNFGSRHDNSESVGYVSYATGFNVTDASPAFSTVMGCSGFSAGDDPSATDCNRKEQLSSPLVTIDDDNGIARTVGASDANNVRFLSERRGALATRNSRLPSGDFTPGLTVTSHKNADRFPVTRAFNLIGNFFDDNGIASVKWEIVKPLHPIGEELLEEGMGVAPDYSFTTSVLDIAGVYRIRVTVTDSAGQTNTTSDVIFTEGTLPSLPVIDTATAGCGNNYCINLRGDDFGFNARVDVRENTSNSPVLESYSGNLIHNQSVNSTTGKHLVRFPIVSVDQQTKFRNNGLCFTLFNGSLKSNEKCFVRPFTNPQGDFMGETVESFSAGQDLEYDAYIVKTAGTVLKIWGNSWKKIDFNYTITPDTVLEFVFKSTHQEGEVSGIGFIASGTGVSFSQRFFQVHGTQTYGIQDFNNYSGNGEKTYRIPIGQYFTGQLTEMVFASDDDEGTDGDAVPRAGQANLFISPVLSEDPVIDDYDNISLRGYTDNVPGDAEPLFGGQPQQHNFHQAGDVDWVIFTMGNGSPTLHAIKQGDASVHMIAYEVTGHFTETSPGRWDITQSDLTMIDNDFSTGNNNVTINNTSGLIKTYVISLSSSGPVGSNTFYTLTN